MEKQRRQLSPEQDALEHIVAHRDKPFLEERFIDFFKGRGVFTHKAIEPSTFVVEYRGNSFSHKDTTPKKKCDTLNNFLFEFSWKGAQWCIDASKEDGTLGRLVNDDHISPNCEMKKVVCEGKPHLCLFAVTKISPGEEITYNYGDSSYPWRSNASCDGSSTSYSDFYASSSTQRNKRLEDSSASSFENPCSGDYGDELRGSGPSHGNDSFGDINCQLDFRDNSPFADLDSSQGMTGTLMLHPDNPLYTQEEDEAASSSKELGWDGDDGPSEAPPNTKGPTCTSKNYCYVCGKGFAKLTRHLLRHADEEPEIAEALALPQNSTDRKRIFDELRNWGNYLHNKEVLKNNSGELKLRRRPSTTVIDPKTHVHCLYCKGMYGRKDMWRHVARCPSKTSNPATGGKTRVLGEIALAELPLSKKIPSAVRKLLSNMKQDEIASAVQNDFLLIQLAQNLCEKYGNNSSEHIRQKLREMGRLLLALREKSIFSFEDAIKPKNFFRVVEAVKDLAGFDEKMQSYNKPSLALKLGHSLKKIGTIVLTGADCNEQMRDTKTFMKLCAKEWSEHVSQTALASLSGRRVNNPSTIPFTRDVQAFFRYLQTTTASAIESMEKHESQQVYNALCKVTLAQASVLSKCAPEVSKMTLKTFQERDDSTQVLSKHFIRINIPNRTGQNVAVLLTSELVSAITLLVNKRKACGVHKDNPFLFAKPDSSPTSLHHGRVCIRAFSILCHAKNPEHLRAMHFHKHIARVFQILYLENDELDHLAKLLGHNIRADKDYYRLPEAAVELAKIAKLLLAMEKGSLERFEGNSLDQIEIEDELEPDEEQGNPENYDVEEDIEESDLLLQQSDAVEQQDRQLTPEQDALEHIKACSDKPFLKERFIDSLKGRGVFTHQSIEPSTFVVEFRGNIFSHKETRKKECGDTLNNYFFDFSWNGTNWHIDASKEDGTLGRLVNDDHISPNCEMKKVVCEGKPHLCLFAVTEISPGEEITYNYGDTSYPWRSTETSEELNTSQTDVNAASSPEDEGAEDSAGPSSSAASCCDEDYVPSPSNNRQSFTESDSPDDFTSDEELKDPSFTNENDEDLKDHSLTNRNYCYVCGVAQSKISRHLFTHRHEEPDIAEVLRLRKNSKERKALLDKLRDRGNTKHNEEVLKTRCGQLKVKRKSSMLTTAKTLATCVYCNSMYIRKDMWRHMQKCSARKSSEPWSSGKIKVLTLMAAAESTDPQKISSDVRKMLNTLKNDEISSEVLNDSFILQLAQCLYRMNRGKRKNLENLKLRLRQMGRLLLTLKKKSICSFEDAIKPQNFSKVVEGVRELAGFNEETKSCDRPSVLKKMGNSLKKIGGINFARALKGDADKEVIHEAETFINLCAKEWRHGPSSKTKVNNPPTVPFIHDVQLFYQCLDKIAASAVQSLTMYESSPVYSALLRVTLAQVSVLNTNMAEVSKATLKSFKEQDETELHEDAAVSQSQLEQILSKHTVKINIETESGQKVAVTLTPKILTAMTLLVNKRDSCGVHENNPFLFARPDAPCSSFQRGQQCAIIFAARCGAKNTANLRSVIFHKHLARLFLILSLSNDDLDQLAKLLGRDIQTDREYYQTPEAAVDIAKISALLSAMENGSLQKFEGKSLEEIEVPDELEPDVQDNSENSDAEEDNEKSESSLSGLPFTKGSLLGTKKTCRASMSRKRSRGRRKRQESETEASELNDDKDTEVITERDDGSDEMPVSCAVNTPEKTANRSNEDATHISFSDADDDMNVDFDMDTDDDIVRNEENDEDGDTTGSAATPLIPDVTKQYKHSSDTKKNDSSPYKHTSVADLEETMDIDTVNNVERRQNQKKGGKQNNWIDVASRSFSDFLNTEKKNKLSAAVIGMKEVKILIPKLDIEKFQASVKSSQLSSECNSVKSPVKDWPIHEDNNQGPTSATSTDVQNKPSYAKASKMNCSHCKKSMMKGQTAYQKKGFTDVFCSKNCLFEMFPINKPVTKTCHYCLKAISQPLDLIMAAVDIKGTMKDFCSTTCLLSFKSNTGSTQKPQRLCSMCNESCTTTCELTLNEAVHTFCSDSCLDDFRRDNMAVCENCSSNCRNKPLKLELEEETKTICSHECLDEFKEKIETLHQCTMCHTSQTISDMVDYKNDDNVVKLFCNRNCVTSYKLRPATVHKLQEKKSSDQLKKGKKGKQSKQQLNPKEVKISQDSTVNENDAPAAAELDNTSTFIIEASCVACCNCGQRLPRGEMHYQPKSSLDVFCSAECLSERHPHSKLATKTCYNCFQVIMRPQNIILAPVNDSGTMKELCSDTCLASVNSKRKMSSAKTPSLTGPWSECKMCAKYCYCKFRMTLDGLMQRICSDCFINYHRINNLPVPVCDVCGSVGLGKRILLKADDSSKTICSEECLIKFKEKVRAPQLCPMCQTSHHLSDMVEKKNDKGTLDFYCSNRCMMVHKAQSSTVSGRMSLSPQDNDIKDVKPSISPEENDIKEVKPSIPNLDCIKEEPIDEAYNQNLPSSISTENIKDEPKAGDDVAKEDLKIGSVFSLTGNLSTPTSTAPTVTHMDLPASCSNCKQVLVDGETVYQRKGHANIFCSTPCLLKCYQMKQVKKTCHFCLQGIAAQQDILQAPVDNEGTLKDFCSQSCLSSFSYKSIMSTKIPLVPVSSQSQCSMCSRYCISKHEIIQEDVVHKICSDPCFLRFCNMNNLSICENCHSPCKTPVMLKMDDGSKKLCNAECLAQFKRKIKTPHPCAMCHTSHLMSDMFENKNGEDVVELFCTSSCVMASKIQAVSASGTPLNCDRCGRTTLPACHLAMSDASIRNFCTLTCAMSFKESQKDMAANSTGAADPSQCDFLKPPEKLPCAQCRRIIKASPKVIQQKGKIYFVCGLTCCQEFNRVNNIMGKCEYCNNERIIRHVQKFDGKDQDFCSDGCKMLFQHELEIKWGQHCGWCAYCFSFSKIVVTAKYEGADKDFCSENCSSNYKMILCHVTKCDTCGLNGKLRQSLPMLGEVKHFCDLRCLLHFCNKKVQMVNTVSSPPRSSGTVESFPVIANVISLASALARQPSTTASSAQHGLHTQTLFSVPDIQTKVVGHASVQTVPKEMKNKSMLCTPLVHNKGVSCTTQTVDTEAQTDNFVPKVIVLPVPVPVYVPLPMNMYSQYTPTPLGLPLPLPVPVFLPDPTVKVMEERIHPDPLEEELNFKSERKKVQDEKNKREHRVVTKEGRRREVHAPKEHSSNYSEDLDSDHQATFNNQKDSSSDTSFGSLSRPNTHKKTPRFLEVGMHREPQPELPPPALEMRGDPQGSPSAEPAPVLLQQTVGKVHNKNKGRKLQQSSRAAEEAASQREKVMSRKRQKLESQCGIAAWKRWIQWRKSQTNLDLVSYHAVTLNEDVLRCSASELSDSLCCFITEVKRPDGEPYSPDSLFYLCLSIQQYLFENGRMENIFSDLIYNKFSTKFNKILKGFKPSISASGYIHSRVEEEFLWDCKQLGAYSPIVLLNTLLFFFCKYFGFTTVEQHRQLSFACVMRCTKTNQNNTKTSFLRFYPPISINKAEPDGVPAKKRKKKESMEMMENSENPLRCPVRLYEFYLSKCSESLRQRTDSFYLSPDGRCVPNSPLWFSSTPLDDGTMEAMLVRILAVRELQGEDRRGVDQHDDTRFIPDEEDLE
ncbi:uncharacterized protein LOC120570916 isoform X3 [Perca fluviatilis]|uniref:uncharacterized protein LOC120570916 isoform X2 n=1 Tax=Perca fluviatilis TaxID=8168 RepID=UPI001965EB93|nr:uncharacterized protein LOC120570916 isoform X2 [Perca fluviatilis]XP_039675538.1 uncharacterized protein LOC120570916 isoform X3 [Perca fluviatilis]